MERIVPNKTVSENLKYVSGVKRKVPYFWRFISGPSYVPAGYPFLTFFLLPVASMHASTKRREAGKKTYNAITKTNVRRKCPTVKVHNYF